jgi:hypothetical protein
MEPYPEPFSVSAYSRSPPNFHGSTAWHMSGDGLNVGANSAPVDEPHSEKRLAEKTNIRELVKKHLNMGMKGRRVSLTARSKPRSRWSG